MTGLLGFLVSLIVLCAVVAIFMLAIDRVMRDAFLAKIAKIAVGAIALIVFILAVANALGLGGSAMANVSPMGIIYFAIAVLAVVVVLYLCEVFLPWIGGQMGMGTPIVDAILFIICAVALIVLLYFAGAALLGGQMPGYSHFMAR